MTATPPPIGPRGLAVRCMAQGAAAARAGRPWNASPYGADRPFSARAWVIGYARQLRASGARMPSDVTADTTED